MKMILRFISIHIIILMFFSLSIPAEARLMETKTAGKLSMVAILSAASVVVKILVNKDQKETARVREKLGSSDRSIEFREGFDLWRIEWHGKNVYVFRNGVLYRQLKY